MDGYIEIFPASIIHKHTHLHCDQFLACFSKGLINSVSMISMTLDIHLLSEIVVTRGLYLLLLSVWLETIDIPQTVRENNCIHYFTVLFDFSNETNAVSVSLMLNLPPRDLLWCCDNCLCHAPSNHSQTCCPVGWVTGSSYQFLHWCNWYFIVSAMIQIHRDCHKRCLRYSKS